MPAAQAAPTPTNPTNPTNLPNNNMTLLTNLSMLTLKRCLIPSINQLMPTINLRLMLPIKTLINPSTQTISLYPMLPTLPQLLRLPHPVLLCLLRPLRPGPLHRLRPRMSRPLLELAIDSHQR